jgi:hypothetical protein
MGTIAHAFDKNHMVHRGLAGLFWAPLVLKTFGKTGRESRDFIKGTTFSFLSG